MANVYNRQEQLARRRHLRKNMPQAEVLLWCRLRGRQVEDLKFRRQFGIGTYVVDFYCPEAKLAIEVDGDSHFGDDAESRDGRRQAHIESYGIKFLRCTNGDVYENLDGIVERIHEIARRRILEKTPLSPP